MRKRYAKQENVFKAKILNSKIFTVIVVIVLILIAQPLIKKINQQRYLNREISELEGEVSRIENKNKDLRDLIDYLESDSFVEKEARVNLDLRRPGEKVAVIKNKSALKSDGELETVFNIPGLDKQQKEKAKSNFDKWYNYFFAAK